MNPPLECDPRYQSLDLWRGLACLMVVLDHTAGPVLGWDSVPAVVTDWDGLLRWLVVAGTRMVLGPPMFFVISGYCIAASVDSLRRKGKPAGEFLARRLWRTFPPYWVAFVLFAALTTLPDRLGLSQLLGVSIGQATVSPAFLDLPQWVGNLTLTETWRHHIWGESSPLIYTKVAWSLCYQEQFYAACFLAVLLAPRRLYGVLAAVTAAVVGCRVLCWEHGALERIEGLFPVYWHEFAVGLAAYWRLNVAASAARKRGVDAGLLGLLAIGALLGDGSTAIAAGFGLVLIRMRRWDGPLASCRLLAPLRACGRRSYSIYLIHLPVCLLGIKILPAIPGLDGFWPRTLALVPVVCALGIAAGWLFYDWVESRFVALPVLSRHPARTSNVVPAVVPG